MIDRRLTDPSAAEGIPITEWRAVAFGDLLHLVVVGQHKETALDTAHLFHLGHDVLIDTVHDLLQREGGRI